MKDQGWQSTEITSTGGPIGGLPHGEHPHDYGYGHVNDLEEQVRELRGALERISALKQPLVYSEAVTIARNALAKAVA